MRTWPVPWVWANVPQPARVQALRWLTMRARRSLGVLATKLTVSVRGDGPQYLPVTTAMLSGSDGALIPNAPSGTSGALTGLIPIAWRAALTASRFGTALMPQEGISCPPDGAASPPRELPPPSVP